MMMRLRRTIYISVFLLFLPSCLWALMSHVGYYHQNLGNKDSIGLTVYGFIDAVAVDENGDPILDENGDPVLVPVFRIEVSPARNYNNGRGINLDVLDGSNSLQYQIAPSSQGLTLPGAIIGTFSVISSQMDEVITITHTPLYLDRDNSVTVDWELAIGWELDGEPQYDFCLGESDISSDEKRKIIIDLDRPGHVVRLHDAKMYFRLNKKYQVTESGDYTAWIKFEVAGI